MQHVNAVIDSTLQILKLFSDKPFSETVLQGDVSQNTSSTVMALEHNPAVLHML